MEKKQALSAAERKRISRQRKLESGLIKVEIDIDVSLKSKLEYVANKEGIPLKDYIAKFLSTHHSHIA